VRSRSAWLRSAIATWRRMGPRDGTVAAARLALAIVRAPMRRALLRRFPLRVSDAAVRKALGAEPTALLRRRVRDALPTVARFEAELDAMPAADRAEILERAERAARHRFDLLGSGPTDLGDPIDWTVDFKSGRHWPAAHISQLPIVLGGGSDIKVPWELSRFQHLPLLAAAHRLTGEERWLDEIGNQLDSWIQANPVEFGPNWACTMDVAIRAANWIAALVMVAGPATDTPWMRRALGSLLLHGRFIRGHLEWAPTRGNHYLSDIAGLLVVAALFGGSDEGRRWAQFAVEELAGELAHQVREDGCDHEASIPYHRLVAELLICATQAADAIAPGRLSASHHHRIEAMLQFTADYTRPDGLAPQVGDADDGRFLPLGDYGADPRSHLHLFSQAGVPPTVAAGHAAYPDGGYWIMRSADVFVLVRCGDVGVGGLGSHAHNDALGFEMAAGRQPLVIDPGSFLYTADPVERNRFRSTAFHSTLQIDGAEQNPLRDGALFAMEDLRRAEALAWDPEPDRPCFRGRHHGYERLPEPATHTRRIELDADGATLHITDSVISAGEHDLQWTFPLAPCTAVAAGSVATAGFAGGATLEITVDGAELSVEDGWLSPSYGRRERAPFVRARKRSRPGDDVTALTLRVSPAGAATSPAERRRPRGSVS
jgi:hypothetical protein